MSFWRKVIKFPYRDVAMEDLVQVLRFSLGEGEIEILCEELLGWPSRRLELMDEFDLG